MGDSNLSSTKPRSSAVKQPKKTHLLRHVNTVRAVLLGAKLIWTGGVVTVMTEVFGGVDLKVLQDVGVVVIMMAMFAWFMWHTLQTQKELVERLMTAHQEDQVANRLQLKEITDTFRVELNHVVSSLNLSLSEVKRSLQDMDKGLHAMNAYVAGKGADLNVLKDHSPRYGGHAERGS